MSKQVYISADYDESNGDYEVVKILKSWGTDNLHKTKYIDMADVKSGSVSKDPDCRICDLKKEFNEQINASSAVIFVVGDKTASRTAGSECKRNSMSFAQCYCTPYKENYDGKKPCKEPTIYPVGPNNNVGCINEYSYLRHEFEQAKKRKSKDAIIIVYNSLYHQPDWLPNYMSGYEDKAIPFWKRNSWGDKVGDYDSIKKALGID